MVLGKCPFGIKNVHGGLHDWETDEAKLTQAHQVSQKTVDVVFLQDFRAFFFCKLDTSDGNMLVSYHPGIERERERDGDSGKLRRGRQT